MVHTSSTQRVLIFSVIALLVINGISAIAGGYNLVFYPDGQTLGMDTQMLSRTPFTDFLLPGIILLTVNGISSLIVAALMATNNKYYPVLLICQGVASAVWILIQIWLIAVVSWLQLFYGAIGVSFLVAGLFFYDKRNAIKQFARKPGSN
ncbi:MAG: hypothetical protein P4L41_08650 [Flavipsychrobacter sp.]|nr:hypothetical protein [Flavipsychrobacter sp.]